MFSAIYLFNIEHSITKHWLIIACLMEMFPYSFVFMFFFNILFAQCQSCLLELLWFRGTWLLCGLLPPCDDVFELQKDATSFLSDRIFQAHFAQNVGQQCNLTFKSSIYKTTLIKQYSRLYTGRGVYYMLVGCKVGPLEAATNIIYLMIDLWLNLLCQKIMRYAKFSFSVHKETLNDMYCQPTIQR